MVANRHPGYQLTEFEQRGILCYINSNFDLKYMDGWFMLSNDGRNVIARRIRGRNHWQYCLIASVLSFDLAAS